LSTASSRAPEIVQSPSSEVPAAASRSLEGRWRPLAAGRQVVLTGTTAEAFANSVSGAVTIIAGPDLTTFDYTILKIQIGTDAALRPPGDAAGDGVARFMMPNPLRSVLELPAARGGRPGTSYWGWANWTAEPPSRLVIRLQVGPPGTILRLIYAVSGDQLIVERAAQRADRTVVLAPVRYSRTQSG